MIMRRSSPRRADDAAWWARLARRRPISVADGSIVSVFDQSTRAASPTYAIMRDSFSSAIWRVWMDIFSAAASAGRANSILQSAAMIITLALAGLRGHESYSYSILTGGQSNGLPCAGYYVPSSVSQRNNTSIGLHKTGWRRKKMEH